jgi:16S rRNA (uracil1498-N3)-methyltransferase
MADRYFASEPIDDDRVVLAGPEAHHLIHVMRGIVGQQVVVFDGSGFEFVTRIEKLTRREAELTIVKRTAVDRELEIPLTLGVALPKGDRQKWLVEKAVELGVTRIVPLQTARGVAEAKPATLERLRRAVIEASKQSGRTRLLEIAEPEGLESFLSEAPQTAIRMFAHPGGRLLSALGFQAATSAVYAAIGPEGGFADDEVSNANACGWRAVGLGARILRVETAALALATHASLSLCVREANRP